MKRIPIMGILFYLLNVSVIIIMKGCEIKWAIVQKKKSLLKV